MAGHGPWRGVAGTHRTWYHQGVHAYRSSLCKGFSTMSHTTTLRTLIQAPDLLVMPGIFDGFSARLVEQTVSRPGLSLVQG